MSISKTEEGLAKLYAAEAAAAGAIARHITTAFTRLADAHTPLKASAYDNDPVTGGGGHSDPTATLAERHATHGDRIANTRHELRQLVRQMSDINKRISVIVGEWGSTRAPKGERESTNMTIWCSNHLAHGTMEPRGNDGGQFCTWCRDTKSRYGKLPNADLIALKGKRGRIDDATYRRLLGRGKVA